MRTINKNLKLILVFIIGVILSGGIVYAVTSASQVIYIREGTNINNVSEALNELYLKSQTLGNCKYFEFDHQSNNQINCDFTFLPSKMLVFIPIPNGENIFIMYNINKDSLWALGSNGNRHRVECYFIFFSRFNKIKIKFSIRLVII